MVYNNFDKIEINNWNFFLWHNKLKIFLNDEEILKLNENNIFKFTRFFARGKFFAFILLNKNKGLKILYNNDPKYINCPQETLSRIIKIQKNFYKKGVSFDCEEEIFTIYITDKIKNLRRKFYGCKLI